MNSFSKNKKSIDEVGNDLSPERSQKRKELINRIIAGGSSSPTDIYYQNSGWITNKEFKKKQQKKELFQTIHSNFLAQPKYHNEKYCTLDPYREYTDYENQKNTEEVAKLHASPRVSARNSKSKSIVNNNPNLTIEPNSTSNARYKNSR